MTPIKFVIDDSQIFEKYETDYLGLDLSSKGLIKPQVKKLKMKSGASLAGIMNRDWFTIYLELKSVVVLY